MALEISADDSVERSRPWLLAGPGAAAQTTSGPELVQQLRAGGYVLLMRHAHSPSAMPAKNAA